MSGVSAQGRAISQGVSQSRPWAGGEPLLDAPSGDAIEPRGWPATHEEDETPSLRRSIPPAIVGTNLATDLDIGTQDAPPPELLAGGHLAVLDETKHRSRPQA
jgi:hypothetical protein